jgi:hypothetical protein
LDFVVVFFDLVEFVLEEDKLITEEVEEFVVIVDLQFDSHVVPFVVLEA